MRFRNGLLMLTVFVLWGCHQPAQGPIGQENREATAWVTLQIQVASGSGSDRRAVGFGEKLQGVDRYGLKVEVGQQLHLYALQSTGNGPLRPLAGGEQGDVRAAQDSPIYLPGKGAWFYLSEHPGGTAVYLVASVQPLGPDQVKQETARGPTELPEKIGQQSVNRDDPPPKLCNGCRGYDPNRRVLVGWTDGNGVTTLRFPFGHE